MPHTKAAKTSAWSAPQVTLCQDAPFFQLPIEVLAVISDFVQSKAFCRTCLKTWAALRGRHLVMNVNPDNAKRRIAQVKKAVAFRTLRLQMDRVGNVSSDNDSFLRLLRVLQDKPHLQSLNLDLWPYTSHDGVISAVVDLKGLRSVALTARDTLQVEEVQSLGALKNAPVLHTLALTLVPAPTWQYYGSCYTCYTAQHLGALASLKEARALEVLTLRIAYDAQTDPGLRALRAIMAVPSLSTLDLMLQNADPSALRALGLPRHPSAMYNLRLDLQEPPSADCISAMTVLKELPALRSLHLSFEYNALFDPDFQALSSLKTISQLKSLTLRHVVTSANVPVDWQGFAFLKELSSLETLVLGLAHATLGSDGLQALVGCIKSLKSLRTLDLDLTGCNVGDRGGAALSALKDMTSLETLTLKLASCGLGDAGAVALGSLREATSLRSLFISVAGNRVSENGAKALRRLRPLEALTLDLRYNR